MCRRSPACRWDRRSAWNRRRPRLSATFEGVNQGLRRLEEESRAFLDSAEIAPERQLVEFLVEARYPFQERELAVPLKCNKFTHPRDVAKMVIDFNEIHDRILGSKDLSQYVECVMWRARAIGLVPKIKFTMLEIGDTVPSSSALKGKRAAYFQERKKTAYRLAKTR